MAYLKLNNHDYSKCVSTLKISKQATYKSQANAAGNLTVKYITTKRTFTVGIIPLDAEAMAALQSDLTQFFVNVSYRDPETNELIENVKCILPLNEVEYYTVQADRVLYKAFLLTLQEM